MWTGRDLEAGKGRVKAEQAAVRPVVEGLAMAVMAGQGVVWMDQVEFMTRYNSRPAKGVAAELAITAWEVQAVVP